MATIEIRDTKKYGRTYKFRTLIGTDENGVCQYARTTWKPPEGLSPVKEKKLAEAEAYRWEQEIKNGKAVAGGAFSQTRPVACDPSLVDDIVRRKKSSVPIPSPWPLNGDLAFSMNQKLLYISRWM